MAVDALSSAAVRLGVVLLLTALLLSGCDQAGVSTRTPTSLTIAGATAMHPVLRDLTAEFSRQHPNVVFDLRGGGSTLGEDALRSGQVDLAASTLFAPTVLNPDVDVDDNLVRTPIGLDGLTLIVHASNPVRALTLLELQRLYSGRIIDWGTFGNADDAVEDIGRDEGGGDDAILVSREDGSGARILFESRVMGDEPVSLTSVVMPTSAAVVEYVARNPQAIGYASRAYVAELLATTPDPTERDDLLTPAGADVGVIAIEGVLPTAENLLGQQYALAQPLYLITNPETSGDRATHARQFIDFALSPAGQEIVGHYHARVR